MTEYEKKNFLSCDYKMTNKFQELKNIAREHRPKIKGFSHMSKQELLQILLQKEVISQDDVDKYNHIDHERLKYIRNNPVNVEILDNETGERTIYHSIYSAGKDIGLSAKGISFYDGKIYRKRYEIKCLKP